jgi:hypothetical protein
VNDGQNAMNKRLLERTRATDGGFAFLPGGLAYSQGVVALPGYSIERVRFQKPVPVEEGFERIEAFLAAHSRPLNAVCAIEMRSPKPLSLEGFREFNRRYAAVLKQWDLVFGDFNAVARSNVAPVIAGPNEPSFFAFSITIPSSHHSRAFVVAGSSEWPEGGRFPEDVVRFGDTSPEAILEKANYVFNAMSRRISALGVSWEQATTIQSYSAHEQFDFLTQELFQHCVGGADVVWHYCRPPVVGWDFEMDVRGVRYDRVLE